MALKDDAFALMRTMLALVALYLVLTKWRGVVAMTKQGGSTWNSTLRTLQGR